MNKYRVVIIGFGHMHINEVARHFFEHPQMELVACADTVPAMPELRTAPYTRAWNMDFCVRSFKIPRVYEDYREMLDAERPDIAIVTSENVLHREITRACAEHGVSVNVEKPMAVTLSDALDMVRAAQQYGVTLTVNWPVTWIPAYMRMKTLLDDGEIGRVLEFKIRTSHTGPLGDGATHMGVMEAATPMTALEKGRTWWHQLSRGGGAMFDFCCYGSMLSYWLLGQRAESAFGLRMNLNSQFGDADDNALLIVRYPEAVASIETSWTTSHELLPSNIPMLYGTEGVMTLVQHGGDQAVKVIRRDGSERYFEPWPVEERNRDIASALARHREANEPLHPTLTPELNLEAMAILDAGVRSAVSGRMEMCNSAFWCIG